MSAMLKLILNWFSRLKNLQVLALIVASPVLTAISLLYLYVIVRGPWGTEHVTEQLELVRDGMMYVHLILLVCIVALTAGLVRSVGVNIAGKAGLMIDLADDKDGAPSVMMQNVDMSSVGNIEVPPCDPIPEPDTSGSRPIGRE